MTRILFVRHGHTYWNEQKRYQGFADIELNSQGISESQKLSKRLAIEPIEAIYSSPLKRAMQTADIVNKNFSKDIIQNENLKEINFGDWEGLRFDEIVNQYPELSQQWIRNPDKMRPPKGENFLDLQKRAIIAFEEIYNANKGKNVLIVSHGGLISVLICHILQIELAGLWRFIAANTGISVIEERNQELFLTTFNEYSHLKLFKSD